MSRRRANSSGVMPQSRNTRRSVPRPLPGEAGGGRVRRVRVEDVLDTADGKTYMDGYTPRGVNLGDDHAYATPPAVPEDMADITICDVRARSIALLTRGAFTRLTAENIIST